jgi:uncharacterized membrane protein
MDDYEIHAKGMGFGALGGAAINIIQCFAVYARHGNYDTYYGGGRSHGFWSMLGLFLAYAAIGALVGFVIACIIEGVRYGRSELEYGTSAAIGAILGVVVGLMICNFACFRQQGYYNNISGLYWGSFAIFGAIGAVVALIVALFNNKEIKNAEEEQSRIRGIEIRKQQKDAEELRKKQEQEAWEKQVDSEIDDIFKK